AVVDAPRVPAACHRSIVAGRTTRTRVGPAPPPRGPPGRVAWPACQRAPAAMIRSLGFIGAWISCLCGLGWPFPPPRPPAPPPAHWLPAHFVQPDDAVMRQIARQLPPGGQIATIPVSYHLERDGQVVDIRSAFAILEGDVDGDGQPEYVVGCYAPLDPAGRRPRDDRARI